MLLRRQLCLWVSYTVFIKSLDLDIYSGNMTSLPFGLYLSLGSYSNRLRSRLCGDADRYWGYKCCWRHCISCCSGDFVRLLDLGACQLTSATGLPRSQVTQAQEITKAAEITNIAKIGNLFGGRLKARAGPTLFVSLPISAMPSLTATAFGLPTAA